MRIRSRSLSPAPFFPLSHLHSFSLSLFLSRGIWCYADAVYGATRIQYRRFVLCHAWRLVLCHAHAVLTRCTEHAPNACAVQTRCTVLRACGSDAVYGTAGQGTVLCTRSTDAVYDTTKQVLNMRPKTLSAMVMGSNALFTKPGTCLRTAYALVAVAVGCRM